MGQGWWALCTPATWWSPRRAWAARRTAVRRGRSVEASGGGRQRGASAGEWSQGWWSIDAVASSQAQKSNTTCRWVGASRGWEYEKRESTGWGQPRGEGDTRHQGKREGKSGQVRPRQAKAGQAQCSALQSSQVESSRVESSGANAQSGSRSPGTGGCHGSSRRT